MKEESLRKLQLFWAYFIGLGALLGGGMFFYDPSGAYFGMELILPILRAGLPCFESLFDSFIPSGVVLIVVNGIPNLVSAWLIHKRHPLGVGSAQICAVILFAWIALEIYLWGFISLTAVYFFFAMLQLLNAIRWRYTIRKVTV